MHPEFSDSKEDGDTTSDTGMAQDEIPVHPRKRKLRAKTEAQSREQAENRDVILEKPPNPYELYLNLRRQVPCFCPSFLTLVLHLSDVLVKYV